MRLEIYNVTNFGRIFKIFRAFIPHRALRGDASENVKRLHATANLNVNVISSMHFRCVLSTKGRRLEIYSNNFESCREHDEQYERGQGRVEDLIRKVHKLIKSSL